MIKVIQAPNKITKKDKRNILIFLAGSIEMGKAEEWQKRAIEYLNKTIPEVNHKDVVILNPRRDDWNPSWEQKMENKQFYDQVTWELDGLDDASAVLMYFSPGTISPISLYELGKFGDKMSVVCPEGFHRKGNVDIICDQFDIEQFDTIEEALDEIIQSEWLLQVVE